MLFHTFTLMSSVSYWSPTTPRPKASVWASPLSLATTYGIDFSFFSSGYWDVSLHRVSRYHSYVFRVMQLSITPVRLPHSEISGSKRICRYPKLIAAYHVLHRLLAPRHPPYTLNSLFQFFLKWINHFKKYYRNLCLKRFRCVFWVTFQLFGNIFLPHSNQRRNVNIPQSITIRCLELY